MALDMDWIWKAFDGLQDLLTSLAPQPVKTFLPQPTQLNDHVYEVCKPAGRPSIEIVFFHGLQLDGSKEAYITTWLSRDRSELWPCWIAESFSGARVLLVSYDGSFRKNDNRGRCDMYITGENLVQSLTEESAQVGRDGCPVVLVGHCIGGLVIKELLLEAHKMISLDQHEYVQCLLESLKAVFYYATPHHGSKFADIETEWSKGPLFEQITTLNTKAARSNEDFRKLRRKYRWRARGIAETLPVTLGTLKTKLIVPEETSDTHPFVEEASTRSDVDTLYTVHADHFDVCRPKSNTDSSFSQLIDVIRGAFIEDSHDHHKMSFSSRVVGLDDQVEIVTQALKKARRLGIVGTGGMGKSTLAKAVYNSISGDFEYTCFLSSVKTSIRRTDTTEVLQQEISDGLYYKGRRKTVAWSRLKKKKILFVLDDVDHASQVYATLGGFSDESCVLITSRDRRLVRSMDFEVHDVKLLNDEASNQLFCLHAFKGADAPEDYKKHVDRLITKCGGLPLALEVTGKYLATQNVGGTVFVDTFNKLSQAKPLHGSKDDELWAVFQVIYDGLAEDEQQMFLDIATCFQSEELESVKRAWRACSWAEHSADAGWQNLLDKGLVTLVHDLWSRGKWNGCIQMHEVLRNLGRKIACPGRKTGKESTRICYDGLDRIATWPFNKENIKSLVLDGLTVLQANPHFKVRILKIVIKGGAQDPRPTIDIQTLSGLEKLEILWLDGVELCGPWNLFPVNLEFLKLGDCYWGDQNYFRRLLMLFTMKESSSDSEAFLEMLTRGGSSSHPTLEHPTLRHIEIADCRDFPYLLNSLGLECREQIQAIRSMMSHLFNGLECQEQIQPIRSMMSHLFSERSDNFCINIGEYTITALS